MTTLKDRILDFVKMQGEPVLISDIAKGIDCDLTTTQKAVLELHKEGVLFRSLSKGKALFSASSENGEGLTPVQTGNARVARTLNAVLGGGPAPVEESTDDVGDEPHRPFDITLSFTQGKRLKFKDYSIGIPDGFEYKTDFDGRDFAIWMPPTEDPDLLDPDGIPIMSPIALMENAKNDESPRKGLSEILLKKVYAYAFASGMLQQNIMGTAPEVLDTKNVPMLYYRTLMANYSVHPIFNKYVKGFTFRVDTAIDPNDDPNDPDRARFNSVLASWIDTVELCDPYPVRKSLDDPGFFKDGVSKNAISEWGKYAAEWSNQSTFLCTQAIQYEVYRYNATHPVWSFTACKSKLLSHLEEEANYYNKMLEETLSCVEKLNGTCSDDMLLLLCKQALEIAAIDRCSRSIDDDEIIVKTDAPQVRTQIKEFSQQMEQKEQKKKQDLKQGAKLIRENLLEQIKQRVATEKQAISTKVEELKQYLAQITQIEVSKQKQELAAVQAEFDSVSCALNSMGLLQFKQKSDAKAKLQQLQLRIEQLKQSCQAPDSADIRRAKTALEQAEKEFADCSEKQKRWKKAVEKACSIYEERVNLHLDYISGKTLNLASRLSKSDREDYELMCEVYNQAFHATISEMRERSYVLGKLDNMKVALVARKMLNKGYLSKTVSGGKTYLDGEKYPPKLIDDTDWDITQPPIAPDIDSILSKS